MLFRLPPSAKHSSLIREKQLIDLFLILAALDCDLAASMTRILNSRHISDLLIHFFPVGLVNLQILFELTCFAV